MPISDYLRGLLPLQQLPAPPALLPPAPPQMYGAVPIPLNYMSADLEDRRHEPKTLSDWGIEPIEQKPGVVARATEKR